MVTRRARSDDQSSASPAEACRSRAGGFWPFCGRRFGGRFARSGAAGTDGEDRVSGGAARAPARNPPRPRPTSSGVTHASGFRRSARSRSSSATASSVIWAEIRASTWRSAPAPATGPPPSTRSAAEGSEADPGRSPLLPRRAPAPSRYEPTRRARACRCSRDGRSPAAPPAVPPGSRAPFVRDRGHRDRAAAPGLGLGFRRARLEDPAPIERDVGVCGFDRPYGLLYRRRPGRS